MVIGVQTPGFSAEEPGDPPLYPPLTDPGRNREQWRLLCPKNSRLAGGGLKRIQYRSLADAEEEGGKWP